jgi:outer membrane usher protein
MRCPRCGSARRAPEFARRLSGSAILVAGWLTSALAGAGSAQSIDTRASRADTLGTATLLVVPTVNGAKRDVALLVRDTEGRFYADDAALADWRVAPPYPAAVEIAGRSLRPLDGLPGFAIRIEERSMTAEVVVPPDLMLGTRRSLAPATGRVRPNASLGAFLDYDVTFTDDSGAFERGLSALLTPTVFTPGGSLSTGVLYAGGVSPVEPSDVPWVRLDTAFVRDDVEHMRTLRVGDAITPYASWARAVRVGGVQFGTNFATQPELITFPQPSIDGTAAVPSALDVVVNGTLRSSTEVPSGAFHLDQVPVVTGAGQIQVVTRDLLGREQVVTQDFYVSERLLKPGLDEYSVTVGAVRTNYGIESNAYGELLATGMFGRGLSEALTIEGRVETTAAEHSAGVTLARAVGRFGVATAAVALSGGESSGVLWQVGHDFQGRVYRATFRVQGSRDFVQPGLETSLTAFPRLQFVASGGRNFGNRGSLGVSYIDESFDAADAEHDRRIVALSYSRSLSRRLVLSASASRIVADENDTQAVVALTRALGPRSSVSSLATLRHDDSSVRVDQRYELPAGPGFGYRTSLEAGDRQGGDFELAANTDHAYYSAEMSRLDGAHGWRAETRGSIAALGGEVFAAREISDGFAVIDASGFQGVRVYLENREIGTTNAHGRLLVPSLRPYESNQLRVESADLPINVRIDNPSLRVAPYYRSGAIASFGITATSDALLRVLDRDGRAAPEGGSARVDGGSRSFPVGLDGRLYLQDVHAGSIVEVVSSDDRCTFVIGTVPASTGDVPDLGDVVCARADPPTAAQGSSTSARP